MLASLYPLGNLSSGNLNTFPIIMPPIPSKVALNFKGTMADVGFAAVLGIGCPLKFPPESTGYI